MSTDMPVGFENPVGDAGLRVLGACEAAGSGLDHLSSDPPRNLQLGQTTRHHDQQLYCPLERQL
jgi:hypothetical protein